MKKRIGIIGAGPAGLALAYRLVNRKDLDAEVILIEEQPLVGGLAASFEHNGLYFDLGSHRLHPATSEELMGDIKKLLGDDLLNRPRNGRIRLMKRFVRFPLKPLEFLFKMPSSFVFGILGSLLSKPFRRKRKNPRTFREALEGGLGKTICKNFYFPYAVKLWGLEPDQIDVIQAQRRVAAGSIGKIIKKVLSVFVPGLKKKGAGRFYYPARGYGQIYDAYMMNIVKNQGQFLLANKCVSLSPSTDKKIALTLENGARIHFDLVFSTIPVTELVKNLTYGVPGEVKEAAEKLKFRGMVFCYFILNTPQFTPYDAHYFPETEILFSRLSEPKNYSAAEKPAETTGICAEIPCAIGDETWEADEETLAARVREDLKKIGLPVEGLVKEVLVRRTRYAYPQYALEFDKSLATLHGYLDSIDHLVVLGRQGLFAHDNTHHTMDAAYRAADCLKKGFVWDKEKWLGHLEEFKKNVVED